MKAARKAIIAAIVALLALVAWRAYIDYDERAQQRAIAAHVAEASAVIRESLSDQPSPERVLAIESILEALQGTRKSRQLDFASAAEHYLVGARAIAQRRVDAVRLTRNAQAARTALAAHMAGAADRGQGWIRQAAELKRRMTQAYTDLKRTQEAVAEILYTMPAVTKALALHVDRPMLVADAEFDAAHKRAQKEAAAAAAAADAR
jgi:hypothetical protein